MMPTPFVLNDAVIIRQKVKATPKIGAEKTAFRRSLNRRDSLKVAVDSLKR
jgi:hypothetical protein